MKNSWRCRQVHILTGVLCVEAVVGAGKYERSEGRTGWRKMGDVGAAEGMMLLERS